MLILAHSPLQSTFTAHKFPLCRPPDSHQRILWNPSGDGFHTLNSPIYSDSGCYLFTSCLNCPLPSCKDDLRPKDLRHHLLKLHHPSVITGTES